MALYFLKKANGKSFKLKKLFFNLFWLFAIAFSAHKIYRLFSISLVPEVDYSVCSFYHYITNNYYFLCLTGISVIVVFYCFFFKKLKWRDFDYRIKIISHTCVLLLAWNYIFYDYNYFLNHWDLFDRLLMFITVLLAIYNPAFLILVVIQSLVVSQQFQYPLFFDYSFTDKSIVFSIIIIVWLFAIVKSNIYKALPEYLFFIIVLGIICNWYWLAGLGKLEINWVEKNKLYKLYMVTLDYNWLYSFEWETKRHLGEFLKTYNNAIQIATIIVELVFSFIILLHKRISIFVLVSFVIFHFSVFFTSGIFFWKWIVVEIVVIFCFLKYKDLWLKENRKQVLLSYFTFLITMHFYASTTKLSWFDSGIYNKYEFKAKNNLGEIFNLEPSFFAPYDLNFAQNRFDFVNDDKIITSTFGSTLDEKVLTFNDESEILKYANSNGKSKYNAQKKENLIIFVNAFVNNRQQHSRLDLPNAPAHIWQGKSESDAIFKHPLDSIFIIKKFRYVNDNMDFIEMDEDVIKFSLNK